MFTKKNLKFISILSGAFILFAVCPAKALDNLSADNAQSLSYSNTGTSLSTTGYGMSSSNGSVADPSTSTDVELSLTMSKFVAMAINTSSSATTTPGGPFGSATVPRSQFAIRSDINDLKTNSIPEFIIEGLVAANVDNVKLDFDPTLTLIHDSGASAGEFTANFTGIGGSTGGYYYNLASGDNVDTGTWAGVGAFKLSGNIAPASVDYSADRAGTYTATMSLVATAQ
jgi:hypothetical protein